MINLELEEEQAGRELLAIVLQNIYLNHRVKNKTNKRTPTKMKTHTHKKTQNQNKETNKTTTTKNSWIPHAYGRKQSLEIDDSQNKI